MKTTHALRRSGRRAGAALVAAALLAAACGSTVPIDAAGQPVAAAPGVPVADATAPDDGLALPGPDTDAPSAGGGESSPAGPAPGAPAADPAGPAPAGAAPTGRQGAPAGGGGGSAPPAGGRGGGQAPAPDAGPLKIGFTYLGGDPFRGFGMSNPTPSDDRRERWAQAMADEINATGGFAGRKVELFVRAVDNTDSGRATQERLQTEACVGFTEDDKVFMVIGTDGARRAHRCYVQHRTPVLMTTEMGSQKEILSGRPWILPNLWLNTTRMAQLLPHALCEQGFGSERIGIFAYDDPDTVAAVEQQMVPAFDRCGKVVETYFASPTVETVGQEIASAILQFRQADVDRVAFMASGGGALVLFANQAESQVYRPWYGVSTYDRPSVFVPTIPEAQRANVYGAGVYMPVDINQQRQPPLNARERQCFEVINRRADENFTSRGNTTVDASPVLALATCELFWVTQEALQPFGGRTLAAADVIGGFFSLGGSYNPVSLAATRFTEARADAVDVYAPLRWGRDCQCMYYDGAWRRIPFD